MIKEKKIILNNLKKINFIEIKINKIYLKYIK